MVSQLHDSPLTCPLARHAVHRSSAETAAFDLLGGKAPTKKKRLTIHIEALGLVVIRHRQQ
jgi:hypothetical protein